MAGPPGKPRPITRASLSKASPAASSMVWPNVSYSPHPLTWTMNLVFNVLEPFAKDLWFNEIAGYGSRSEEFVWSKQTYFGSLYQKVVAERRS